MIFLLGVSQARVQAGITDWNVNGMETDILPNDLISTGGVALNGITLPVPASSEAGYAEAGVSTELSMADTAVWEFSNGKLTVYSFGELDPRASLVPWINHFTSITIVEIKKGITHIPTDAFATDGYLPSAIETVILPEGLTSIGEAAFYKSEKLTNITFPESLTRIVSSAFANCSGLTSVTFPAGLTTIDNEAFYNCTGLTSVVNQRPVPQNITRSVFGGVVLDGITLSVPAGSEALYVAADVWKEFKNEFNIELSWEFSSGKLTLYSFKDLHLDENIAPWSNYFTSITIVEIKQGITHIPDKAFYYPGFVSEINSVIFPDDLISIGNFAFSDCKKLTHITFPESLTDIGKAAFSGCTGLTSVTNQSLVPQNINRDVFGGLVLDEIELFLPESSKAFYAAANVWQEFYIENLWEFSRGKLTVYSFRGLNLAEDLAPWCEHFNSIKIVEIKQGITHIPNNAFDYFVSDPKIDSVILPNGLISIGDFAFLNCKYLTRITFPESLTSIRNAAFSGCTGLTSIINRNPVPQSIDRDVFNGLVLGEIALYVPEKSEALYVAADVWKEFDIQVSGPESDPEAIENSDATLKKLIIQSAIPYGPGITLAPPFTPDNFKYETTVWWGSSIVVNAETTNPKANIIGTEQKTITIWGDTVLKIRVIAENNVTALEYEVKIIKLPIDVTGISNPGTPNVQVYMNSQTLYINTPISERIGIYSVTGKLLYRLEKPAGKASFPFNHHAQVLIVKGSSGWVKKLIIDNCNPAWRVRSYVERG
jgi:hypothetical protein